MSSISRFLWRLWTLWFLFLLVIFIASYFNGTNFGTDNLAKLAPGAQTIGNAFCDFFEMLGFDFSAIRGYYDELRVWAPGYTSGSAFVIFATWSIATFLLVAIITRVIGFVSRQSGVSYQSVGISGRDVVSQRILAIVFAIVLIFLFSPGWPVEGPLYSALAERSSAPTRDRQSSPITESLDSTIQDWAPDELSPACKQALVDGPNQLAARLDGTTLRLCGEAIKSALTADATMGRETDPSTESAAIRFLLEASALAKNGQLDGVGVADSQFRDFERFAKIGYPDMRQEGWRQASQRYLGLLQFPDERTNSQDARMEVGYKLSVLAELLYNADDTASHDMAYRIAVVTGDELGCVPASLMRAKNDQGTPIAAPDLPSCLAIIGGSNSSGGGFVNREDFGKPLLFALALVAIAIPFVPWSTDRSYIWIYAPLAGLMAFIAFAV